MIKGVVVGVAHAQASPTFSESLTKIVNYGMVIAASFSVLIFVYAGFVYVQSQGDPSKVSLAKELVSGVIVGMAIILLIKVILPTLGIVRQ